LVKPTKVKFDERCKRWLDSKHVREVSQQGYRYALKDARKALGRIRVQNIARSDIQRTVRSLKDDHGLSHRSVVYALGAIKQVLAYGITEGVVAVTVAASVKAPRKQHGDTRPQVVWEHRVLLQFRDVADTDELAAAWRLTLCGLRRSEVMGLRWDAVDLDRG
jgi:site-specific recombinase XerC